MTELTEDEKQVMRVFKRVTGCFGKEPQRDAARRYGAIVMGMQAHVGEVDPAAVGDVIVALEAKGLLNVDREKETVTLTDAGYDYITKELD